MDLSQRKLAFIQQFHGINNEKAIIRLENVLQQEVNNHPKTDFKAFSIEDLNKRIDLSLLDSTNDNVTENSLLLNEIEKY
jgi:hypothetical protein